MKKTKRSLKKYLAILLVALLAISSMCCFTAFAAGDVSYIDENGETQTVSEGEYTSVTANDTAWETGTYVVDNNRTIEDTRITVSGDVILILEDGKTLTASLGIEVAEENSLTIYAQEEGTGALNAGTGSTDAGNAGIGGNSEEDAGTIIINGGVITAESYQYGAAIGGGRYANGGTTTINGGTVTATAQTAASVSAASVGAAGIGGGSNSKSSNMNEEGKGNGGIITINGGTVTAAGGRHGANIGGGNYGNGGTIITINGGTVIATRAESNSSNAGIGGGSNGGANITITGGTVNSASGTTGAAIGGGNSTSEEVNVEITGGNVTASATSSSQGGAAIGGGAYNSGNVSVKISGGYVEAVGGQGRSGGAAIGGGYEVGNTDDNEVNISVEISGGTVIAESAYKQSASQYVDGIGVGADPHAGFTTTFSTGEDGHAVIYTSSITDETGMDSWSGVISKEDIDGPALVYGTPVITDEEQIPSGKTAWIEDGKVLEIAEGFTLTNNGTVYQNYTSTFNKYVEGDASMENYGTYEENGITWYEVRKADSKKDITVTGTTTEYEGYLYSNADEDLTVSDATDLMVKTYKNKSIAVTDQTFTMPLEPVLLTDVLADSVTIEKIWKDVNEEVITATATASCPSVYMGLFALSDAEDNIKVENGEYYYTSSSGESYKIDEDYYARDDEENIVAYYDYTQDDAALYVIVSVLDTYATVFQNPVALSYDSSDENYGWVYTWDLLDSELSYVVMELTEDEEFEAGTPAVIESVTSDSGTEYTWQVENKLTTEITAKENPVNIYVYDGTEIGSPEGAPLSGAGFILSRVETVEGEEVTYYAYCEKDEDGCWAVLGWIPEGSEYAEYATILTSGDDGYIRFSNIDSGEYRLTEVTAPAGYLLPTESIGFTVDDSGTVQSENVEIYEDGITIPVANVGGSEMPLTGGTGTIMYTMAGLLLIICAVYLLYRKKRTEGGIRQRE